MPSTAQQKLAQQLAETSPDRLRYAITKLVLAERRVSEASRLSFVKNLLGKVQDFYDLALVYSNPEHIYELLTPLTRYQITAAELIVASLEPIPHDDLITKLKAKYGDSISHIADEQLAELAALLLMDRKSGYSLAGRKLPETLNYSVADMPQAEITGSDSLNQQLPATNCFEFLQLVSEVLQQLRLNPIRLKVTGEPTEQELSRLCARLNTEQSEHIKRILRLLHNAQLIQPVLGNMSISDIGIEYLQSDRALQWTLLAKRWVLVLRPELRDLIRKNPDGNLAKLLHWLYPETQIPLGIPPTVLIHIGNYLGLLQDGQITAALLGSFDSFEHPDVLLLINQFPSDTDQLYIQADGTAIAPGQLPPAIDFLLRGFAERDSTGMAQSYRFTPSSINRAWRNGYQLDDLMPVLDKYAVGEISQNFKFQLQESFKAYQSTRVIELPNSLTLVESDDEIRLKELKLNPKLHGFRWREHPQGLTASFPALVIYNALWASGYPAKLINAADTNRSESGVADVDQVAEAIAEFLDRVKSFDPPNDNSWAAKSLEQYIGSKQAVLVVAELPGKGEVEFLLELKSSLAGRVRGRDVHTDVERTLPFSSIRRVIPPEG